MFIDRIAAILILFSAIERVSMKSYTSSKTEKLLFLSLFLSPLKLYQLGHFKEQTC